MRSFQRTTLILNVACAVALAACLSLCGCAPTGSDGGVRFSDDKSQLDINDHGGTSSRDGLATKDGSSAKDGSNSKGKKTQAGNAAIVINRTASERMATSSSINNATPEKKTVYLTFDDGPSPNTTKILNVLSQYGVVATWFVKGNQPEIDYVKDVWAAGHQVALHTYSHDYKSVYASSDAYWNDLNKVGGMVKDRIGFTPTIVRFPGGSYNSYNQDVADTIIGQLAQKGYHYFDWNVSSGDGATHTADEIAGYVMKGANGKHSACVLMHDSAAKDTTVEALPRIIEYFIDNGYEFDVLMPNSFGYHF